MWKIVLGVEKLESRSNNRELGGDSLLHVTFVALKTNNYLKNIGKFVKLI